MSYILCLETSATACTVALSHNGACIATKEVGGEWQHSKMLTLLIQDCLEEANLVLKDIAAVAISKGPGSYTGLRVGASCGKGLCYALDIPLLSIPTLEIIAQKQIEQEKALPDSSTLLIPMIDARRLEVYYNIYDYKLKPQQETTNLILEEGLFYTYKDRNIIFCGDGAIKMQPFLSSEKWDIQAYGAHAQCMSTLAYEKFTDKNFEDLAYYVPFYLKLPHITKSKKTLF